MNDLITDTFKINPDHPKPRKLNQTWIKDIGYDQAPYYSEKMGIYELEDFLSATSSKIDHVKITTNQILNSPDNWIKTKVKIYKKFNVQPYLDHTYFMKAYELGSVEKAIITGSKLGFEYIEFMSTYDEVNDDYLLNWRKLSKEVGMNLFYEHHPKKNWFKNSNEETSKFESIIKMANPFLNDGAKMLVMDHEEFELQNNFGELNYEKIIEFYGKEKICFEVTSPKEGNERWLFDLKKYFKLFGTDINVCNIMPSQILTLNSLRNDPELEIIPKRL